jgi:ATP-dependent DNA helicase Rep
MHIRVSERFDVLKFGVEGRTVAQNYSQMLSRLNPQQRAAVKYLDGPLLVLAGAGSGKTRVITHKIAYLVQECGYSPNNIAAITFTNKAAREMKERVGGLLQGKTASGLTVTTFHSLGMQILRAEAKRIGYKPQFSILDAADSMHVVSDILKTTDKAEIKRVQYQISRWKNDFVSPDYAKLQAATDPEHMIAKLYERYQDTLHAYQAMDFDDLIRLPVWCGCWRMSAVRSPPWATMTRPFMHGVAPAWKTSIPCSRTTPLSM